MNAVSSLYAEKMVEVVLLYISNKGFPASFFKKVLDKTFNWVIPVHSNLTYNATDIMFTISDNLTVHNYKHTSHY